MKGKGYGVFLESCINKANREHIIDVYAKRKGETYMNVRITN